jgi:ABC-2 type transport system permease protein/oleandomycin transport system permease protein
VPRQAAPRRNGLRWLIADVAVMTRRVLARIAREPETLMDVTIQPVIFVLLFAYVFGGAIPLPGGGNYHEYLIGGMLALGLAMTAPGTAVALVTDMSTGLIDRFRSLPMSRGAVLMGRTLSDIALNCLSLVVLLTVGFAAGFNFHDANAAEIAAGVVLCLLLGYAFSWIFALIGLFASSPETANAVGFIAIFPLTFASSIFVPVETMPDGLRQIAEANPFTTVSDAVRSFWLGTPAHTDRWMAFVWAFALIAIFAPLAVARYRSVAAK